MKTGSKTFKSKSGISLLLSNIFCRTQKLQKILTKKIEKIQSCRIKWKKIICERSENFETKPTEVGKCRKTLQVAVVLFLYKTSTSISSFSSNFPGKS